MKTVPVHVVPAAMPDALAATVKVVPAGPAVKLPLGETLSHVLFEQLCWNTWALALVSNGAVTVNVCEAGADPPATALNVKDAGLNVRTPAETASTLRVTVAVLVTEPPVIVIVPLHEAPAAKPVGFTDTVKFVPDGPPVKLPLGESVSQLRLVQLCSVAWAVALVFDGAVTVSVMDGGAAPLGVALNVSVEVLNVSSVGPVEMPPVTFRVTFAVCVAEPAVTEIVPLHVVPAANPD
jgi:hypothetical protein